MTLPVAIKKLPEITNLQFNKNALMAGLKAAEITCQVTFQPLSFLCIAAFFVNLTRLIPWYIHLPSILINCNNNNNVLVLSGLPVVHSLSLKKKRLNTFTMQMMGHIVQESV